MHEKRAHTRRMMQEDAFLSEESGGGRRPVILLDISRQGICFTSAALLPNGERRLLQFCLPGNPERLDTLVEVVHSTSEGVPSGFRVGARFIAMQPHTALIIAEYANAVAHG